MKAPFIFGKIAQENTFTNREKELKRLITNFENNINTIIISPRRWGKTSLVKEAARRIIKNKRMKVCLIDLFYMRNEQEFYSYFTREIIKSISSKVEEITGLVRDFIHKLTPKIRIGVDAPVDIEIDFDRTDIEKSYKEILDMPERIAKKKNISIIVCIDEFQNIGTYPDYLSFQKRLRSVWQHHKRVSYCLYGSKRHMLMHLFEQKSQPFYKFGDVIYLQKIDTQSLTDFIITNFNQTKKKISRNNAKAIVTLMKNHPYYVQQLAYMVWINTKISVTKDIINNAKEDLLAQNSLLYQREVESLSNTQIYFLKALVQGVSNNYTSKEVIGKYKLGTSANVIKIIKALTDKEIIDSLQKPITFIDPAFNLWLKENLGKK